MPGSPERVISTDEHPVVTTNVTRIPRISNDLVCKRHLFRQKFNMDVVPGQCIVRIRITQAALHRIAPNLQVLPVIRKSQKEDNRMAAGENEKMLSTAKLAARLKDSTVVRMSRRRPLTTADKLGSVLKWTTSDLDSGRWRKMLYRFLTDNIPVINSCVWTWVRLAAAPGEYRVVGDDGSRSSEAARDRLGRLSRRMYSNPTGNRVGLDTMLPELFTSLYRDGLFGGFLTVVPDGSGVDQFLPVDPADIRAEDANGKRRLILELEPHAIPLDRPDFYYVPFNGSSAQPFGRSILQAIPFVAYVEQQLVDDMKRASHNSGFHRLHVKITPPERLSGESDTAYTDRINNYFDSTVGMIKTLEVDDNPVTWNNVEIEHIAPGKSREVTNSWFMSHRAMVEEICAGTHLAPYLLGYSYGATSSWSGLKFDIVMRQVRSVQAEVGHFLEWVGNIDLALAGLEARCEFVFDNSFAYQAADNLAVRTGEVDNILKLYQAGLIDEQKAVEKACRLI